MREIYPAGRNAPGEEDVFLNFEFTGGIHGIGG